MPKQPTLVLPLALLLAALSLRAQTDAMVQLRADVVRGYANGCHALYGRCVQEAKLLQTAVAALLAKPEAATLAAARVAWTTARRVYGESEALRYYDGPIEPLEPLLNAWPIDEVFLDYVEGQEITGKPSGADLRERKVTLPLIAALRRMPATARREVERFFEISEPGDAAISRVISLVVEADGIEYARRKGELFAQEAEEIALALPDTAARSALLELVGYVLDRRW